MTDLAKLPVPYDLATAERHARSTRELWREYQGDNGATDREMVAALDKLDDAQQAVTALIRARVQARIAARQSR